MDEATQQCKDELLIVAGIEGLPCPPNSPSSLDIQEDAVLKHYGWINVHEQRKNE